MHDKEYKDKAYTFFFLGRTYGWKLNLIGIQA